LPHPQHDAVPTGAGLSRRSPKGEGGLHPSYAAEKPRLGSSAGFLMNHPFIARALEAGAGDDGRPYFVMEL